MNCLICQLAIKPNRRFCSSSCAGKYGAKKYAESHGPFNDEVECTLCSKVFTRKKREIQRSSNHFCSRSCATSFHNHLNPKRKRGIQSKYPIPGEERYCTNCNQTLMGKKNSLCQTCSRQVDDKVYIQQWLDGKIRGGSDFKLSNRIRRYLIKRANSQCTKCGWNKIHPTTGVVPLEINHIDGNGSNHSPENLEVICPNCHSLTKHYKALNRGNGRPFVYARLRPTPTEGFAPSLKN